MKRKRGHKKGSKSKKPKLISDQGNSNESTENVENQNSEQSSGGPNEHEHESRMEFDVPSSIGSDHSHNVGSIDPDGSADNMATKSVGRVKVKLKTSKVPEPDISSHNDTEKSSPQTGSDRSGVASEKKEENVLPPPERKPVFLGNVYRKTKGIKIKTSKAVAGTSSSIENTSDAVKAQDDNVLQKDVKTLNENSQTNKQESDGPQISLDKKQKTPDQTSRYKKQELHDSLIVIKKVMKMDAAEPFNVPVNPEALGIPDYFDIIDTPMDFGTICNNIEKGDKYRNSEDVYKDVRYIWDNCCKYNKKGDYIMDLMKRVKKNFMKYWTAAGLYTGQSTENNQVGDGSQSGKVSTKSGQSKQKSQKRHGRHHKSDCMCAVCILKRRKREREQSDRIAKGQSGVQEDSSPVASPSVENSSLNMGEEQDVDAEVDNPTGGGKSEVVQLDSPAEEKERGTECRQEEEEEEEEQMKGKRDEEETEKNIEIGKKIEAEAKDKTQSVDSFVAEPSGQPVVSTAENLDTVVTSEGQNSTQREEEDKEIQLQKQKELQRREWKAKMHEKFQIENPVLLSLCETLFPDGDHMSVWSGPHSLLKLRGSTNKQTSSIHKAVEALMK